MADEHDAKVSSAYRALGAEEPARALDEAILAAARRAAAARPAPLAARASRQRWYAPLATAAVLVLAVAVTLNVQRERPGIESPAPQAARPAPATNAAAKSMADAPAGPVEKDSVTAAAKPQSQPRAMASRPARERHQEPAERKSAEAFPQASQDKLAGESSPAVASAPAAAPAPATAELRASRRDDARAAASGAAAGALARSEVAQMQSPRAKAATLDGPERELERIAELRQQQKHDEADKALAEFRKRYPDYLMPEAMRARVERR